MTDESLDAFGPGVAVRARSTARPAAEPDPEEEPPERPSDLPLPISFVYPSRSAGLPHIVSVIDDPHGKRLGCTCKSAAIRNTCWATEDARKLLGWPEPQET